MPITGTPNVNTQATPISSDDVRWFMRDFANNNVLIGDVQFTNAEIQRAIDFATDEWNCINPITTDVSASIPKSILIMGVCSWLTMSESFLQLRDQANVNDGGEVNVGLSDKWSQYINFSKELKAMWKESARGVKMQRNLEGGYGSLSSGYANVGRFQG